MWGIYGMLFTESEDKELEREKYLEEIALYEKIAVKKVIEWCKEQGVKIYASDFNFRKEYGTGARKYDTQLVSMCEQSTASAIEQAVKLSGNVSITLLYSGRWGKRLKNRADNFLNYLNCRVHNKGVMFNFSFKELDFFKISDTGEDLGKEKIDRIIEKINKLLALADLERNPSEHEAISASLKVQKLLAEYNLTMADIRGEENEEEPIEQVIADVGCNSKAENWRTILAGYVADGYACKCFMTGSNHAVVFYGHKADVLLARRVYVYLFNVGCKLGKQYMREHKDPWGAKSDYAVYQSFVDGFASGVNQQLQKQCTALALVCQEDVKKSFEEFSKDFGTSRIGNRKNEIDYKAFREGVTEGKRAFNAQYIED